MGIIARQGIKRSIISAIGILLGIISTIFIYPKSKEAYGFAQFIFGNAMILSLFLGFGSSGLVVRYFPEFKSKKINGYLGIVLSFSLTTILLTSVIAYIFKTPIFLLLQKLDFKNIDYLTENINLIYFLSIFLILIRIIIYQSSNFRRIVIPPIINELSYKFVLPILVLLYYFEFVNLTFIAYGIITFYFISLLLNIIYLKHLGGISITSKSFLSLPKKKIKEMVNYMGFSGLNVLSANITTRIDIIMIPLLLSLTGGGVYSILMFMSNTIAIPNNSLNQIANPVISESMKNQDIDNIDSIYKKTSLNSYIIGALMFIILWAILPHIVSFMSKPKEVLPFLYVFFFLGISKLIDMLTSVNSYIIIYSKYYKYNLIFLGFLAVLNIILNYILIQKYGIVGAAVATAISIAFYNIIKLIFIQLKFNLFPFTKYTIFIIIISFIVFGISLMLPGFKYSIFNILYKPIILLVIYYVLIKISGIKADIIELGEKKLIKFYKSIVKS